MIFVDYLESIIAKSSFLLLEISKLLTKIALLARFIYIIKFSKFLIKIILLIKLTSYTAILIQKGKNKPIIYYQNLELTISS